ncbi:tetratricopeptide repeat protein [Vibrio sp. TRT 21S02]|uniref:tetratricopeptide repeat protein n=1 Tax=unclassified Vibrio TaxID=2614977 RepID=UPI003CF7936B
MNLIGIAIGATGLLLLFMFGWMLVLSLRKKRLEQERKQREIAYRKAIEKNRKQEQEERVHKAENGHIPTILFLAKEAERTNPREALYWYNKAANLDNVTGMYGILRISEKMRDDAILRQQIKYWKICIAALEGSVSSKFEMGQALFFGRGTEINVAKAIRIIEDAAKQNHLDSMIFLGDWYQSPNNPEREPNQSIEWYRKAAQLKSNEGRMKLGLCYVHGTGVAANFDKGCYWLERAAEKGYTEAMYKAGETWMDTSTNGNAIAYIWLFLAGQLGHDGARMLRDQVALNIGVDTVVGLQSLSKPMLKRIKENKVGKHSIIKALNKLYKRKLQLQESDDVVTAEPETSIIENEVHESVEPALAEPEKAEAEKLDFTDTSMGKK